MAKFVLEGVDVVSPGSVRACVLVSELPPGREAGVAALFAQIQQAAADGRITVLEGVMIGLVLAGLFRG